MSNPRLEGLEPSSANAEIERLTEQVAALQKQLREQDARNRELENETVRRGVKLSCARIALTRAKIAFDESLRHREEMVQDVAHDLRTPLTSIKGAAQNLLDGVAGSLDPDAREYVEIVREHSERLIGAVNWLVAAMRATQGALDLHMADLDVGEVCANVVHGIRPIADERGIELVFEGAGAQAFVDGEKLRLVMENLVGNALKFTAPGGRVSVAIDSEGDDVVLRVRDTGVGIETKDQARIFERYYRRDHTAGSNGLGLVICREVVRLHGGQICVKSQIGEGSEFTVRLPRDGQMLSRWVPGCA
jgi:two-component system, OmpR family, phosphate regulon sensor histidine kinase PhoR